MQRSRIGSAVGIVLLVAGACYVAYGARRGLVLDEFHTLFHARSTSLAAFFEGLLADNHPPFFFLAVRAARGLLGESELALRALSIFCALATLALAGRLARPFPSRAAPLAATGLLAASSLMLDLATQARMYAPAAFLVALTLVSIDELLNRSGSVRGPAALLALTVLIGLHTHYFFLHYLGALCAALLAALVWAPELRPRARRLVLPLSVAVMVSLPWYLTGFRDQLGHDLPPGGDDIGLQPLAEALVHLFFINLRLGGTVLRPLFLAGGAAVLLLAGVGFVRLLSRSREAPAAQRIGMPLALAAAGFGAPALATIVATILPRAGFTWHYIVPSALPVAVLASAALGPGSFAALRRGGFALALVAALVLSVLNFRSPGPEDYPGAIRKILAEAGAGDAVIAVEWQPQLFPQAVPWEYYAGRLADRGAELPERLATDVHLMPLRPAELEGRSRVFLLHCSVPDGQHLPRLLRERFPQEERAAFGYSVAVYTYSAERSTEPE